MTYRNSDPALYGNYTFNILYLIFLGSLLVAFAVGLSYALGPRISVNPGVSAYKAPAATELLPRRWVPPPWEEDQSQARLAAQPDVLAATTDRPPSARRPAHKNTRKPPGAQSSSHNIASHHNDHRRAFVYGYIP